MQTFFSDRQRQEPAIKDAESIIRRCVHCGFCLATCPTYLLLGDELDSPRGRIYLIKNMLEGGKQPSTTVVRHIDRCLSCMACMTTCPSDVNYMHLIDSARVYIEKSHTRPWPERALRGVILGVLTHRRRFAVAVRLGRLFKPLISSLPSNRLTRQAKDAVQLLPDSETASAGVDNGVVNRRGRVVLMQSCAEPVLKPGIRAATIRLLHKAGYEVEPVIGEECCGSLAHHLGREELALATMKRMIDLWHRKICEADVSAILTTVSGCGSTLKNYGHLLRNCPEYAEKARQVASLVRDISEFLCETGIPDSLDFDKPSVAYHAPCSLLHAQQAADKPRMLLQSTGFEVRQTLEEHICCGSAGVYNILQPKIAGELMRRKVHNVHAASADVVATSNIGCLMQLSSGLEIPIVHVTELLDWATGGPRPAAIQDSNTCVRHIKH